MSFLMDPKTRDDINAYEENQEVIRQRLIRILRKQHGPSISRLANSIGLSPTTLNRFYKGEKRVLWRVLFTIETWVNQQEDILGLPHEIDNLQK